MKEIAQTIEDIQHKLATIADKIEQVKNLHRWKVPLLTTIYMLVLCILVVATNFLGVCNLLLLGLWFKMGKGALRKYQFLGGIVKPHPPHRINHNPVFDFLSRVPTDEELEGYKQPTAVLAGKFSTSTLRASETKSDPRTSMARKSIYPLSTPRICSRTLRKCSKLPPHAPRHPIPPLFSRGGSLLLLCMLTAAPLMTSSHSEGPPLKRVPSRLRQRPCKR